MAENSTKKIKVITAPDIIFDQSHSILVITPSHDTKEKIENYEVELEDHIFHQHWIFSRPILFFHPNRSNDKIYYQKNQLECE
jgi:hypothetical protein